MRRVAVVLVALFLVNLPFVRETLAERRIATAGREVEATVVAARTVHGHHLVDYRLPRSLDPERQRFSARVDTPTYANARETRVLAVRAVPGEPADNRPLGAVGNGLFAFVALSADAILLLVAVLFWRRWRRWSLSEVVGVEDGWVTLRSRGHTVTVSGPQGWTGRVQSGDRTAGALHLEAAEDVLPGPPLSGLEHVGGASYEVRGRVVDARAGRVVLEMDDGFRIVVKTGVHRIRADIRDSTQVHGTLCFTPTVSRD